MKLVFSSKASGTCNTCQKAVVGSGYFLLDINGAVKGVVCQECQEMQELSEDKSMSITIKKLKVDFISAWLGGELYQIVTCKNMYFPEEILTKTDLLKLVKNPNISVTIKY